MAARTWILAILLATTVLAAGCTNNDAAPDDRDAPPAPGGNGAGNEPPRAPNPPSNFAITQRGPISGPFEESWEIEVANVAFRDAGLRFALEGTQPGAPPTALIHLKLYDPNGALVESGSVGLGAGSNELTWSFSPGQLPLAGVYVLKAASAEEGPLPSAGFAQYELEAHVSY